MAAKSPTLDADMDNARAYLEFWAQGSTQLLMYNSQQSFIPTASDVDASKLDRLSAKVRAAGQPGPADHELLRS